MFNKLSKLNSCTELETTLVVGVLTVAEFQNDRKHVGRNLIQTLAAIFIL